MSRRNRLSGRHTSSARLAYLHALEARVLLTSQPTTWTPLGVGQGGTSYYANMNPLNPNEIYLETDMGEVWHTTDSGLHWTTLNMQTQLSSNNIGNGVQYTNNTNIQYAITGGSAPMVTKDDGADWTQLSGWASTAAATSGAIANRLLVDNTSSNRLLLMAQKQVGSTYSWWVYYSTDGGNTLTLINTGGAGASDTSQTDPTEIWASGAFWNGSTIYFATNKGLYTSTNGGTSWTYASSASMNKPNNASGFDTRTDTTWAGTNVGLSDIISFTGSTSGGTTRLYAITWDNSYHSMPSATDGNPWYTGIYTSTNGGATWTRIDGTTFGISTNPVMVPHWVQVVDGNVSSVWVGGEEEASGTPIVYSSSNAGTSWTRLFKTGANTTAFPGETPNQNVFTRNFGAGSDYGWGYIGEAVTFTVDRANSNIIDFTTMGTIFGTIDGGANWYDLSAGGPNQLANTAWNAEGVNATVGKAYSNSQANETSIWDATIIDPNTIFLDSTDVTGELSRDGGNTWSYLSVPGMSNPNTFYQSVYVPSTDTMYAVTSNKHDIFTNNIDDGEIENFGDNFLVMSTNHGATWTVLHTFPNGAPARTLAIDPNNPNVAYVGLDNSTAGTGGIWKTTDLQDGTSSVWTNLATQPHRDISNNGTQVFADFYPDQITILNDGTIVVVAADRLANSGDYQSPNNLSYTAGVWVSTDGGNTWTDRSSPNGTGSDIYNNGQNMYYTQGNLLSTEAFSVTVDPNDPTQNTWYATTYYFGVQAYGTIYKSTNRGQTWTNWVQWQQNTPHTGTVGQAEDLWIQPGGTIMLATTKEGLFYTPNYTVATPVWYPVNNFPFNGSPSFKIISDPFNSNKVYVTTFGGGIWMADVSQLGVAGIVQNVSAQTMSNTEVMLNWNITAPTGTGYIIQSSTDQVTWTNAATVPSYLETSYMVTGLTGGTKYYFRILSTDAAGNSAPSAVVWAYTDGSGGLAAYEEFTQAAGALNGTGSGSGWSGTWTASNTSQDTVVAGSLNNSNPPDNTGNHISITSSGVDASRLLTNNIGASSSVVWVSFEVNTTSGSNILIGDTTNGIGFGTQTYSTWPSIIAYRAGVQTYIQSSTSMSAGTHFMVARLEYRDDGTVYVRLFLDPTPGLNYPNNELSFNGSWNGVLNASQIPATLLTNKITLTHPSSGTASYDEVRVGGTYLNVAPKTGVAAPSAPTGIAGTVVNQNQVNLSWTNNATNQQGFTVEEFNGTSWSTIERLYNTSTSGTVINYSVTNLAANSTYQFRVSAFNAAGSSTTNATGNLTTIVNPPSPVTNLAVSVSGSNFNLTWSNISGNTGYILQYADATGLRQPYNDGELAWQTVSPNLAANSTAYTFTTLSANKLYYFRIYAINAGGSSTCSNTPSATSFPAPTSVTTSPISDTSILVSWPDNIVGEAGYNVQYSTDNATWSSSTVTAANATQAAISGLSSNTVYYFRVQAFASNSTGLWSTSVLGRTYATLTGAVAYDGFNYLPGTGLNMDGQGSGSGFTGNWTLSDDPDTTLISGSIGSGSLLTSGNKVQLYTSANATRTLNYTLGTDGTSLWVGFTLNQHISGGSGSLLSSLWLGTDANNYLALGSPWNGYYDGFANIGGTAYYMQSGSNPVATVDNTSVFLVYRIDFGSGTTPDSVHMWVNPTPGTQPADTSANSTWTLPTSVHFSFTNNNLRLQGGSYWDQSTFDEVRLGTAYGAVAPVTLPAAPSGLNASPGTGTVTLTWTDNSNNETGFHVQRSTDQATWTTVTTTAANATSYTDTVSAGTYYYRVSSFNGTGDSIPATASATVGGVPAAPSGLNATPGAAQVALTWTDNSNNETGFHVWRSTDNVTFTNVQTLGANVTSFTDTGLSATTYYYYVTSYNGSGDSAHSNTATVTVLSAPSAPSGLSATAISSSQINLAWTDNANNEAGFKVYRSTDNTTFTLDQTINTPNTTSFTDTGLSASTLYYYKVTAFNSGGESSYSNTASATTNAASGTAIASESFSYSTGALNGKGTAGSGWAGAWTANSNPTISSTSLTPPVGLLTSGGSVSTTVGGYGGTRNLSSALNTNGTVWSSVLITPDMSGTQTPRQGSFTIGNTKVLYMQESDGLYHWDIESADGTWYGSHWNAGTNPSAVSGTTYFIVIEQIFNSGSDTVYAWINPTPGSTAPSTASAFETKTGVNAGGTSTTVNLGSTYYSNTAFDEIRIGTTYAIVAPTNAPPAAPSNLVATPGTSNITLSWTDNSTNETGFHVWRSTDNSTWGSAYATVGSNVTTYTDSAASAGVGYYYKITSYNGSGDSSTAATMSCEVATVIAYDGFNYATVAAWNGGNTGTGLSAGWSLGSTTNASVLSGSLTYSTGGHALTTSANSVQLTAYNTATGTMSSSIGTAGTTVWVGFEFADYNNNTTQTVTGDLDINPSAGGGTGIRLGSPFSGKIDGRVDVGSYDGFLNTSTTLVANTTYFIVAKIQYLTTGDIISLYVDPTPGVAPTTASGTLTLPATVTPPVSSSVVLYSPQASFSTFDEVRIGSSYVAVAPDPLVPTTPSVGNGRSYAAASPSLPIVLGASSLVGGPLLRGNPTFTNWFPNIQTPTVDLTQNMPAPAAEALRPDSPDLPTDQVINLLEQLFAQGM